MSETLKQSLIENGIEVTDIVKGSVENTVSIEVKIEGDYNDGDLISKVTKFKFSHIEAFNFILAFNEIMDRLINEDYDKYEGVRSTISNFKLSNNALKHIKDIKNCSPRIEDQDIHTIYEAVIKVTDNLTGEEFYIKEV